MKVLVCEQCLALIRLVGDPEEIRTLIFDHQRWKDGWPCITYGCNSRLTEPDPEFRQQLLTGVKAGAFRLMELGPQELFRALCGGGLPDELGCAPEIVEALLLSSKIVRVDARESPSGRTVLERLWLENGTALHLTISPVGAVVFKITRTHGQHRDRRNVRSEAGDNQPRGLDRGDGTDVGGAGAGRQEHLQQPDAAAGGVQAAVDGRDHHAPASPAAAVAAGGGDDDPSQEQAVAGGDEQE